MGGPSSVLAVVDDEEAPAVWWVNLGPSVGLVSRLCGAWVLAEPSSETLENLLFGRLVLATRKADRLVAESGAAIHGVVDPDRTLTAVAGTCDRLQTAYQARIAELSQARAHDLVPPVWPTLPDPLDPECPPPMDAPDPVRRPLGIARWFDGLCRAWDHIERQRLARNYMRGLGGGAMPVELVDTGRVSE